MNRNPDLWKPRNHALVLLCSDEKAWQVVLHSHPEAFASSTSPNHRSRLAEVLRSSCLKYWIAGGLKIE